MLVDYKKNQSKISPWYSIKKKKHPNKTKNPHKKKNHIRFFLMVNHPIFYGHLKEKTHTSHPHGR